MLNKNLNTTNTNISEWYSKYGEETISKYFIDEDGIFTTVAGLNCGVYEASVVLTDDKEISMYIGEVGRCNRTFRDRITEHAYYWLTNTKFYTGILKQELDMGVKFKVSILESCNDYEERYALEQNYIEMRKPYLQFNCYPKYESKSKYRGNDLCIFPTYRRRAFILASKGEFVEEAPFVNRALLYTDKAYWENMKEEVKSDVTMNEQLVKVIEFEMPMGSDTWRNIKAFVEEQLNITSSRGCQYPYLIRLLSVALKTDYELYEKDTK